MRFRIEGYGGVKGLYVSGEFPKTDRGMIKAAIKKWKYLSEQCLKHKTVITCGGTETCPLCQKYYANGCSGCPIRNSVDGFSRCSGTPFVEYEEFQYEYGDEYRLAAKIAHKGVKFLEKLLK
jgi:hypothetical protein